MVDQQRTFRYLFNSIKQCVRSGYCSKREISIKGYRINLSFYIRICKHGFYFRTEDDTRSLVIIIKRLIARMVPSHDYLVIWIVPDAECKFTIDFFNKTVT